MKKVISIICFLICVIITKAQEEKSQYIRKGLIRSQGTISPGIMLKENVSTISIHGNLEYYVADNVSIRGDGYYGLKINEPNWEYVTFGEAWPFLYSNHQLFAGVSYHIKTKNHFDPYLCLEPGMSMSQSVIGIFATDGYFYSNTSFNPLISPALGFNFYFQRFFHLFAEARYISGKHLSNAIIPLSLNELRFSFGLGWNLNLIKQKK